MTMLTMNLVVPQADNRTGHRQSVLRAGRRAVARLTALIDMTPQQRADRYVAGMPIAVLGS
ncbi:hypothetical protein AO501_06730 [Mycobacterium gordonae]|uniref:Uncharacterized protein n=1 Tax=Mycobacterium gordonae TaxID=1778 RepID=A0A0Q2UKT6_MYCGO|nr:MULTISPECIES: hypothetical protein [Mycobacterium]KQH81280.1 hypothetical protein AO501_06730 [Mycobacterium gordonae]MDP7730908.1 hypothetical protein [Mycobacterium sp. TY813]